MGKANQHTMPSSDELKSWKSIAEFLGQPTTTVQRWAKTGMPVTRDGRIVTASREKLSRWLGETTGASGQVHIAEAHEKDLTAELLSGLSQVRKEHPREGRSRSKKHQRE